MSNAFELAAQYIREKMESREPKLGIILGSGLGVLADEIENSVRIPYSEIPNFPISTVSGHAGELIIGTINNVDIIAMNGRVHYYEGHSAEEVIFPIRIFSLLGIEVLILTNAAGGINTGYVPGSFMVIKDHINFGGVSPLRGKNLDEFGVRFPDMTEVYNKELTEKLKAVVYNITQKRYEGVYAYMQGPHYETPAEIKMLRVLGADAVGMSTVPEAIVARHCGIDVVGISCITNMAAGIAKAPLSHEDVKLIADKAKDTFKVIIKEFIKEVL
ncbi:MAG: purine-nucleoside phosphorylase [Clostridiales bacterium]|nr:purine-nucleoside phosphorylase [Clostridiales bacterium]